MQGRKPGVTTALNKPISSKILSRLWAVHTRTKIAPDNFRQTLHLCRYPGWDKPETASLLVSPQSGQLASCVLEMERGMRFSEIEVYVFGYPRAPILYLLKSTQIYLCEIIQKRKSIQPLEQTAAKSPTLLPIQLPHQRVQASP